MKLYSRVRDSILLDMSPLSFNTPGLLFPAISLLMLAYWMRWIADEQIPIRTKEFLK